MKKLLFLTPGGLLFLCMSVSGQVNTDSLSLVSAISKDQLQLGKLQNQLEEKTNNKQNASDKAQNSADKNSTAADKLSEQPNNKKLAKKAKKEARAAKRNSKNARNESAHLDQLNNDMRELEKRIANNQVKLDKYIKNGTTQRTASDTLRTQL
jgi:DNA repair ATPase RecN